VHTYSFRLHQTPVYFVQRLRSVIFSQFMYVVCISAITRDSVPIHPLADVGEGRRAWGLWSFP